MIAIFVWHVFCHGFSFTDGNVGMSEYPGNLFCALFLCSLCVPASYCFFFITGFFGIKLSVQKLLSIILWMFIVSFMDVGYKYYISHEVNYFRLYTSLLPLWINKWWFISSYLTIYILSPMLNKSIEILGGKEIKKILWVLFAIIFYRFIILVPNAGSSFFGGVFMYILGRYCKKYNIRFSRRQSLKYFFVCAFAISLLSYVSYAAISIYSLQMAQRMAFQWFGYSNPLVILMAVSMFFYVLALPEFSSKYINSFLSSSIFIYLFTSSCCFVNYTDFALLYKEEIIKFLVLMCGSILACVVVGHIIMLMSRAILYPLFVMLKFFNVTCVND